LILYQQSVLALHIVKLKKRWQDDFGFCLHGCNEFPVNTVIWGEFRDMLLK
jgi:hypothetical protein